MESDQEGWPSRKLIRILPVSGCIATGILYGGIGTIALLSYFKVREGGADESSMIAILNQSAMGNILVWVLLGGSIAYICWRLMEAITDPYRYGKSWTGRLTRTGIALSSIADMLIVYSIIKALLGLGNAQENGVPVEERKMAQDLLGNSWGEAALITMGAVVIVVAIIQLHYGLTGGYEDRIKLKNRSQAFRVAVRVMAIAGHCSRGIILGIIGYFMIVAGATENAKRVVNTDKAFDFIGDDIGHLYFIVVALGTIAYGLFMLTLGSLYNTKSGAR